METTACRNAIKKLPDIEIQRNEIAPRRIKRHRLSRDICMLSRFSLIQVNERKIRLKLPVDQRKYKLSYVLEQMAKILKDSYQDWIEWLAVERSK